MNDKKEVMVSHCFKCGKSFSDLEANFCSNCGHELSKFKGDVFSELMTNKRSWEAFAVNFKEETRFKLGVFYGSVEELAIKFSNCNFILELVPTEKFVTVNRLERGDISTVLISDARLKDVSISSIDSLLEKMSDTNKFHRLSTNIGDSVIITLSKPLPEEEN